LTSATISVREEVTDLLQRLIRVDTVNPPGNETRAAELLRDYLEDSGAAVDCNVIGNAAGEFIEIQATAEGRPFLRKNLNEMLDLASLGLEQLFAAQREAIRAGVPAS
jgi:acetylornithine deacetylase/succinyl-diaminopimelate desuccinylase-like protein